MTHRCRSRVKKLTFVCLCGFPRIPRLRERGTRAPDRINPTTVASSVCGSQISEFRSRARAEAAEVEPQTTGNSRNVLQRSVQAKR